MDQKGIKDFLDIARFTPGVSIDNSATNAISIRGISSSGGAGTTGIYIDDTPIQMRSVGFNPDDALPKTFDLERVEILRGPQGTLFGAGAEGGAVRYILTQPSVTSTSSYLRSEASYTQYGQPNYELGVAHGMPIIDGTLGVRASIWYRSDGGWIDRVDPTTRCGHGAQRQSRWHAGGAPRRAMAAGCLLQRDAEHPLPEFQEARRFDLLAGVLQRRCRGLQHGDAGADPERRSILSAGAEAAVGPRQEPDHLQHLLLPSQPDHRLPGHRLRPGLLPDGGPPTSAAGVRGERRPGAAARGIR